MPEKFRLLLALEDEEIHQDLIDLLSQYYEVTTASNAEEVYHKIHHFHPDLALLDYSLKNINPIELYEGIELLHPATTYILCATAENMEVAKRIWHQRAIDYIRKPIDVKHILDDIHKLTRHIIDTRKIKILNDRIDALENQIKKLKKTS